MVSARSGVSLSFCILFDPSSPYSLKQILTHKDTYFHGIIYPERCGLDQGWSVGWGVYAFVNFPWYLSLPPKWRVNEKRVREINYWSGEKGDLAFILIFLGFSFFLLSSEMWAINIRYYCLL